MATIAVLAGLAVVVTLVGPLRLRPRLQQSRRQQHLRPGLSDRDAGDLAGGELPPRRPRGGAADRPGRGDRGAGAAGRRRLVGAPPRPGGADRARRLRRPLPRLPALQRRLLPGQGADDRGAPGDAGRDPPAAGRVLGPTGRKRRYPDGVGPSAEPKGRRAESVRISDGIGPSAGVWRVGWAVLRSPSSAGRSTRASWSCGMRRSGRPATVPSCAPSCRSCATSRCSTRGRTATPPTSCSAPTPTCRWSSSPTRR